MSEPFSIPAYVEIKPGVFRATDSLTRSEAIEIISHRFRIAKEAEFYAGNMTKYFADKFGEEFNRDVNRGE